VKSKLLFLSYKAELMQNLHVRPNFIFEFLRSTLIVSENFLKFYFKSLCPNIFPMFPPNVFFFFQFFHISFFPAKFLYKYFVFEQICTSKFCYNYFACIYFVYNFVFEQII